MVKDMANSLFAGQLSIFDMGSSFAIKVKRKLTQKEIKELNGLREDIPQREQRLADLLDRGDDACSKYDLMMGYNAKFNARLVNNQISYMRRRIAEIEDD